MSNVADSYGLRDADSTPRKDVFHQSSTPAFELNRCQAPPDHHLPVPAVQCRLRLTKDLMKSCGDVCLCTCCCTTITIISISTSSASSALAVAVISTPVILVTGSNSLTITPTRACRQHLWTGELPETSEQTSVGGT